MVNLPNGSEPKGLLKGSLTELESFSCELSVFFLESEPLPDGLNGSELKKLSVGLWKNNKKDRATSVIHKNRSQVNNKRKVRQLLLKQNFLHNTMV